MSRRIVITGLGAISSAGTTVNDLWQHCLEPKPLVETIPDEWQQYSSYKSRYFMPLAEVDYKANGLKAADLLQFDPVSLLAIITGKDALLDAGFTLKNNKKRPGNVRIDGIDSTRAGVYLGTGIGGISTVTDTHSHHQLKQFKKKLNGYIEADNCGSELSEEDKESLLAVLTMGKRFSPFAVPRAMPNAPAAAVALKCSFQGVARSFTVACASGTAAIGNGFLALQRGDLDLAICGGCEYIYEQTGTLFRGFDEAKTLTTYEGAPELANRPFDKDRSGFMFSSGGSASLVLETLESAEARNARIYAEIVGYNETFDAYHMVAIDPEGARIKALHKDLLGKLRWSTNDVSYINAHGTGTQLNDKTESSLLKSIYGNGPLINSTKGFFGHTLGASGALEAIVCALSLQQQTTHACRNLENPVEPLNFVEHVAKREIHTAISESFAFGGHNTLLAMQRI